MDGLRILARKNRKNLTRSESRLWYEYLSKRPNGFKFLKQKPIRRFIADFYCSRILLVIEVDGKSHLDRKNYDEGRDLELLKRGINTIRFSDEDIMNRLMMVINQIETILEASLCQGR